MTKSSPSGDNEKGQSRIRLLDAATELFSEKGYHAVSVKDICSRANVNISSISYHFGGKEGLLNSLLETMVQEHSVEPLPQTVSSLQDFQWHLGKFLGNLIEFYLCNPPLIRLFFHELDYGLPEAEKIYADTFEKLSEDLKRFIEIGRRKSYLRDPKVSNELISLQLLAPLSELVRRDRKAEGFYGINLEDPGLRESLIPTLVAGITNAPNYVNELNENSTIL